MGLTRESDGDILQSPLQNTVLPDQQRDKLEKDILILDDEFGLKEKRLHKEAERQRVSMARLCRRICVIEDGLVTDSGTHAELIARDGFYARLYARQTE